MDNSNDIEFVGEQTQQKQKEEISVVQKLGIVVMVLLCGFPGMAVVGFLGRLHLSLQTALIISLGGGMLGGTLMSKKSKFWGGLCGLIAGPLSVLAIYFYAKNRDSIHSVELTLVQAIASLPALGLYRLIVGPKEVEPQVVNEPEETSTAEPDPDFFLN
ncbi:MAG: hypothetical protein R3C11_22530 [Planctomycetaceae bacterium]